MKLLNRMTVCGLSLGFILVSPAIFADRVTLRAVGDTVIVEDGVFRGHSVV